MLGKALSLCDRLVSDSLKIDFLAHVPTLPAWVFDDEDRLWLREARVISLAFGHEALYPRFQFDAAFQPRPVIAQILAALPREIGAWPTALWFASANTALEGRRPMDGLDDGADVGAAARGLECRLSQERA